EISGWTASDHSQSNLRFRISGFEMQDSSNFKILSVRLLMYIGKIIGRVVCSVKDPALHGRKLLLVKRESGGVVVAIDAVGAGAGETVYVCRGREAAFAFKPEEVPTEAAIVAIVDAIQT